jgi:hypothetical protein
MLLSLTHKFIFVANLKSASSTIEAAIGDKAEIRMSQTKFGKHDGLSAISQKFSWAGRYVPFEEFFVFGVIREPVDFLLSLYNSHQKSAFDGRKHSTKGMSFDNFLQTWCAQSWQAKPQRARFTDEHGRLRMNCLIDLAHIGEEFPKVCARLELGSVDLGRKNSSPEVLKRADLTTAQIERVKVLYRDDYEYMRNRPQLP